MTKNDFIHQMRAAMRAGDLEEIKKLTGGDNSRINEPTTIYGTWLHMAADLGQLSIVKWLLEQGADINRKGGIEGGNALDAAASEGRQEVVHYLLEHGAEMDVSDSQRNPLFGAIYSRSFEVAKLLLEHGIDATVRYTGDNMKNMSAYDFAMERGELEIAALIKEWIATHPSSGA